VELRRETGLTTIIVTHNIEEAVFLGKRILALSMPPNRAPRIVENPEAGGEGWRSDAAFLARCDELRAALGVAV
jgi:NitT/TauT family transport system ATP-binding protein